MRLFILIGILFVCSLHLPAQPAFTQWAETPPMGWNSWDCYGPTVEEHEVKANADYMAEHLKPFGWEYIVVDIRWFVENDKAGGYNQTDPRYVTDEYGRYMPAVNRFPSAAGNKGFQPLADYIHSKGLKFGIHIMRGIPKQAVERKLPVKGTPYTADQIYSTEMQCTWLKDNYTVLDKPGAQEYYNSILELYASWGVDFLKIDDLSRPYHKKEIEMIRKAIDRCGRPIVLSLSPGATPLDEAAHASAHSNMWRMVDDVWDIWRDVTHLMQVAQGWYPYISPAWPDCDMIPLGRISIRGERGNDRMTRLTKDEQYSLMTFFTVFRSPLMFGGDLPGNDEFTLSLLTNREVLRMHRESTNVRQLFHQDGKLAVTSDNPLTGERYLAVFNISDNPDPIEIQVNMKDLGIKEQCTATNLWTGESSNVAGEIFSLKLRPHTCGLFVIHSSPLLAIASLPVKAQTAQSEKAFAGYLFAYFEGSGEKNKREQLRFGVSENAVNWFALNNNQPIIASEKISQTGGIRDPHILRGEDGRFYLTATDMSTVKNGWDSNPGIVMLRSDDLINWTRSIIDLAKLYPKRFDNVKWVWAPQTIYDPKAQKYLVYFTVRFHGDDKLDFYSAYANKDFTGFEKEPKLMFSPKYGGIDGDIIYKDGSYRFFYKGNTKDENGKEIKNGIQQATGKSLQGSWIEDFKYLDAYSDKGVSVEGSSVFKLNDADEYILMYDLHRDGRFEFQRSSDLYHFSDTPESFVKNFNPRHGSIISITKAEARRLHAKWGGVPESLLQPVEKNDRYHFTSEGNPIITHHYTADPAALVKGDTLWLFTGHDFAGGQKGYRMKDWLVFSTTDLKNWTEYPVPLKITDFRWAKSGDAYAGHVVERDGKYYWYISTNRSGIGVAVADRPEGPYKDVLDKPLLTNEDCFASTHSWACIDPAVFIDDDGQAWLFWGNRECYYAKLKNNMIELDGEVKQLKFDGFEFTEAPWIHKHNGKYYLSYATGFPEKIAYAMADKIDGAYEYKGILNEIAGNSNTNHQSIVAFRGEWYFIYHNGGIQTDGGSYSRSVCIDKLYYNSDGAIKRIKMTTESADTMGAYLLAYFKDDTHSLYFATSDDGYTFTDVNDSNPVVAGDTIASQRGIRDPYIMRGNDGSFYVAMTDLHIYGKQQGYRTTEWERPGELYGWGNNKGFVLMKSKDLIHWTHAKLDLYKKYPKLDIGCAWAPELIFDENEGKIMIYFTMRKENGKTKLYYAYVNKDFTDLETEPEILFNYPDTTKQILDADITRLPDGRFCMMYVAQENPGGIKTAFSDKINGGYIYQPEQVDFEPRSCEAPNVWKRIGEDRWVLMYDIFSINPHNFGFAETSDFKHFTNLGHFDDGVMRRTNFSVQKHGAVIHLTKEEAGRLKEYWKTTSSLPCYAQDSETDGYPIQQVKLNNVELTDNFWLPKIRTIQEKTIRYAFDKCESEGRMENFVTAGNVIRGSKGKVRGKMPFDDTDVYKTIEGAAYSLINAPNPALDAYLDSVITLVAYGQEPDGYLTTWRTIDPKTPPCNWVKHDGGRWFDLGMSHELYNAGHLFEAASAHYWATGKRNFLGIALKNADLLVKTFMTAPQADLHLQVPGHQIVETGLIKLYQITGKEDYLRLAKQFLDNRGKNKSDKGAYSQDHKPVTEQDEAVGHAVRAVYMYAGMTDIAAIYNDEKYRSAVDKLWENMVSKKMYITGGLGARHAGEAFGGNYELPNLTAYAETCAAIGGVYWNERLFRLTGKSKYFDVLERMLYNGVISGISFSGTEFFYPNPLEADGKYKFNQGACTRQAWFDCSCCPTNLIRFIPFIPNLIYAKQDNSLYINLFIANKAQIKLPGGKINIEQKTGYPWNGKVEIAVNPEKPSKFAVKIRIPAWVQDRFDSDLYHYAGKKQKSFSVKIDGKAVTGEIQNGYLEIARTWKQGDKITVDFPMEIRTAETNPNVKDNAGKFAVERGPLVYCLEKPLNGKSEYPTFLDRNQVLKYKDLTLIPYYSWANRGVAEMKVWLE